MTSNFFRSCTVASAAVATALVLSAPAQAMSFFNFGGDARLENADAGINGQSRLNFFPFSGVGRNITGRTSDVAPVEMFDTKDIPLTKIAADRWTLDTNATNAAGFPNFMSNFETSTNLSSRLTSFHLTQQSDGSFDATLALWLDDGTDEYFYQGFFSSQTGLLRPRGTTFSAELEAAIFSVGSGGGVANNAVAVPTPAMLPGLFTVTLGMLRRRRGQAKGGAASVATSTSAPATE